MSRATPPDRRVIAARILAFMCVALALMCAGMAWAWTQERQVAACWRAAAMFQQFPTDECRGSS